MNLVNRFRNWLSEELKVDYDTIAADVRGVIEHVEDEFKTLRDDVTIDLQKLSERIERLEDHAYAKPVVDEEPTSAAGA